MLASQLIPMDFDQEHNEDSSDDKISYHGEDGDDDQMSSDDDVDNIDEDDTIIICQRVHLEGDDKDCIAQLLPVGLYIGTLFQTRLTPTNLRRYDMVRTILTVLILFLLVTNQ